MSLNFYYDCMGFCTYCSCLYFHQMETWSDYKFAILLVATQNRLFNKIHLIFNLMTAWRNAWCLPKKIIPLWAGVTEMPFSFHLKTRFVHYIFSFKPFDISQMSTLFLNRRAPISVSFSFMMLRLWYFTPIPNKTYFVFKNTMYLKK